jgi:hypothetical protein
MTDCEHPHAWKIVSKEGGRYCEDCGGWVRQDDLHRMLLPEARAARTRETHDEWLRPPLEWALFGS